MKSTSILIAAVIGLIALSCASVQTKTQDVDHLRQRIEAFYAAKIDSDHKEAFRFENMSLILFGFALATVGLALAVTPPYTGAKMAAVIVSGIESFIFIFLGIIALFKLRKYKSLRKFWGD